jgi:hypothetical protein
MIEQHPQDRNGAKIVDGGRSVSSDKAFSSRRNSAVSVDGG